jgi:hypothetical protein
MQPQDLNVDYNDGVVKGDTKGMPNRGTSTGMNGDTYGADLSPEATNGMGKITGATKSDAPFDNLPANPDD